MADALIGHSGFVGSALMRQRSFDALYRSTDINEIRDRRFDLVICAAAPAQKWIANRNPDADRQSIQRLMEQIDTIECRHFILVSTVDVFGQPRAVDENSPVCETGLHPYGLHRRQLELFVQQRFPDSLVVRLPGLVGPGLRKNSLFDLHNNNDTYKIDSRGVFQFYPMVSLWFDLQVALTRGIRLLHLTSAPISVADIAREGFGRPFENPLDAPPARYDLRSVHAGDGIHYQYSRQEVLLAIRAYAQSEPHAKGV